MNNPYTPNEWIFENILMLGFRQVLLIFYPVKTWEAAKANEIGSKYKQNENKHNVLFNMFLVALG